MTSLKCVTVGDGCVGKTCLLICFVERRFPEAYTPTIFENHMVSKVIDGKAYQLNLFDTGGQEEFDRLRPLAYPDTNVFIVCFSIDEPISLENVREKWIPEILHHRPTTPFILVGTKSDLRDDSKTKRRLQKQGEKPVTFEEGNSMANTMKAAKYVECSAKSMQGVEEVFDAAFLAAMTPGKNSKKSSKCELL